jgi:predicted LPLAT superfamily acyltransferase
MMPLVGALRRGEVVALQGDRALGTRGDVTVDFFGAPATFPLGPFVLARAARVPMLPAFCLLGHDLRYTVVIAEPIHVALGEETAALARWARILETAVRRAPEQWFNFFDVWSASPAP